ncbi:MAG: AtpZ/AtpI family protein [Lachnospiraceae bacterium]|nr:AtpZ/AtpI family protein [Lachnospiraceae bacterium]
MSDDENGKNSDYVEVVGALSMVFQLSLSVIVPIALCVFVGYKLDRWLGTGYLTIIFIFIGIAAGIRSAYMITKGFYAKDLEREKKQQEYFDDLYRQRRNAHKSKTRNEDNDG